MVAGSGAGVAWCAEEGAPESLAGRDLGDGGALDAELDATGSSSGHRRLAGGLTTHWGSGEGYRAAARIDEGAPGLSRG